MPAVDHTHTYIRYKRKPGYYRCMAPNCTHIADKEFLLGKNSLCTACGQLFILSYEDLRRAKPKCLNCADTKEARQYRKAQELTKGLGTDAFGIFPSLIKDMEDYRADDPAGIVHEKEPEDEDLDFIEGLEESR